MSLEALRALPPHAAPATQKSALLLPAMQTLCEDHYHACADYRRIVDGLWGGEAALQADRLDALPYLPVSLFKQRALQSVPDEAITLTLTSSGTTGQVPSRIGVDAETSRLQQRSLADSMAHVLGPKRLPMLILDTAAVLADPALMNARGAGVLGMMRFGYRPVFALDASGALDAKAVQDFLAEHGGAPFFMFGFTFMAWTTLMDGFAAAHANPPDLANATLVHSGGWKSLTERAVDNDTLRRTLRDRFGLQRCVNFYGMVEQIGSVFIEGDDGLLYAPNVSEVIVRDPHTWAPVAPGTAGLIQVLSLLPRSYPGQSLLTEDLGLLERSADGARTGLRVLGRLTRAELRGCSDVIAQQHTIGRAA